MGRTLPGRGAWICAGERTCVQRAVAPDRLRHAFRREVPAGAARDLVTDPETPLGRNGPSGETR